jgi:hypothetical protein
VAAVGRELDVCVLRRGCGRLSDCEDSVGGGGFLGELGGFPEEWLVRGEVPELLMYSNWAHHGTSGSRNPRYSDVAIYRAQVSHGPEGRVR